MGDEELRLRQAARATERAPEFLDRLGWSTERLQAERQARLRELLSIAKKRSPWHRQRLARIDCERATERDLASIPLMTKDDLMGSFDAILTDPDLSRARVEAHLAAGNDGYLIEQYRVVSSGKVEAANAACSSTTGTVGSPCFSRRHGFGSPQSVRRAALRSAPYEPPSLQRSPST